MKMLHAAPLRSEKRKFARPGTQIEMIEPNGLTTDALIRIDTIKFYKRNLAVST